MALAGHVNSGGIVGLHEASILTQRQPDAAMGWFDERRGVRANTANFRDWYPLSYAGAPRVRSHRRKKPPKKHSRAARIVTLVQTSREENQAVLPIADSALAGLALRCA